VNNGAEAPEVSDYQTLDIDGVTAENLDAVNQLIIDLDIIAVEDIQGAVDALEVFRAYATSDGNNGHPPTQADYAALGIVGSTTTNIDAINALIAGQTTAQVDTRVEIQEVANRYLSYGKMHEEVTVEVSEYSQDSLSVVYHPSTWESKPTPVIFFATGWHNTDHNRYKTLLNFVADHGYSVIYVPDSGSYDSQLQKFDAIISEFSNKFDTSRIGVLGHSSGGGFTFKLLEYMADKDHGNNGRFLCAMDPYFAQFMDKSNMNELVDTNVLFVQFGPDGKQGGNETDSRIPLIEYALLTGNGIDKNYRVLPDPSDTSHGYPARQDISTMQGLLKPLDALMEYTFVEQNTLHHTMALEGMGKDDPYANGYQKVLPIDQYDYDCHYANQYHKGTDESTQSTIDNCGEPEIQPN